MSTSLTAREHRTSRAGLERGCAPAGAARSGPVHRRQRSVGGTRIPAGVAQLVERQPSKLNVASSSLVSRSVIFLNFGAPTPKFGDLRASFSEGASGCSAVFLDSGAPTPESGDLMGCFRSRGASGFRQVARASARAGSYSAHLAQLVEHVLGKDEVTSSILVVGSKRLGHVYSVAASDTLPRVETALERGDCSDVEHSNVDDPSASSPPTGPARAGAFRFAVAAA